MTLNFAEDLNHKAQDEFIKFANILSDLISPILVIAILSLIKVIKLYIYNITTR